MTSVTAETAEKNLIDGSKLKPEHKEVLDWLCRHPCKLYEAADVAKALGRKTSGIETCFAALKHQRYGSLLPAFGPWGEMMRGRFAWLPAEAPVRALYPLLEHPPLPKARPEKTVKERVSTVRRAVVVQQKHDRYEHKKAKKEAKVRQRLVIADNNRKRRKERTNAKTARQKLIDVEGVKLAAELVASTVAKPSTKKKD